MYIFITYIYIYGINKQKIKILHYIHKLGYNNIMFCQQLVKFVTEETMSHIICMLYLHFMQIALRTFEKVKSSIRKMQYINY